MGTSRSSLVREVLEPGITEMAAMLRALPDQPTSQDIDLFGEDAASRVDNLAASVRRELSHE
jgi:hypothetical protein